MGEYREKAIHEHGERCQVCGSESDIHIHHRDGDRTNNDLENLIPLCQDCHYDVHHGEIESLSKDLLPTDQRGHISEKGTTLNVTIDEDVAVAARRVKRSLNLTWAEFIEAAVIRTDLLLHDDFDVRSESDVDVDKALSGARGVPVISEDQVREIVRDEITAE